MPRLGKNKIQVMLALPVDLVIQLDRWVIEGGWRGRSTLITAIIENVVKESNNEEELIT